MTRFLPFFFLPFGTLANAENSHSFSLGYGEYTETVQIASFEAELQPESLNVSYAFVTESGFLMSVNAWQEDAEEQVRTNVYAEKDSSGVGVAAVYPLEDFDLEWAYSFSQPELDAHGPLNSFIREESRIHEVFLGVSTFWFSESWAVMPSLQVGYQESEYRYNALGVLASAISTEVDESGWFWSPRVNVSYFIDFDDSLSLVPFIDLSWIDFFEGDGTTRASAQVRGETFSRELDTEFDDSSSGLISAGLTFNINQYYIEFSMDETIDLDEIDTRYNLSLGASF